MSVKAVDRSVCSLFYPVVSHIREIWHSSYSWCAVVVVDVDGSKLEWPFDCVKTFKYANKRSLLKALSDSKKEKVTKFSDIVFRSDYSEPLALFLEKSSSNSPLGTALKQDTEWKVLSCDEQVSDNLEAVWDYVIQDYISNSRTKVGYDIRQTMAWYISHYEKNNTKLILYLPTKNEQIKGGVILALCNVPELSDFRDKMGPLRRFIEFSFGFYDYLYSFRGTEYIPTHVIRKLIKTDIDGYVRLLRQYHGCEEALAEHEKGIVLYPLLCKLVAMESFRWISCFGWHEYRKSLYRIGWDIVPPKKSLTWPAWCKAHDQFGAAARFFREAVDKQVLPSMNRLIFTKARRKRPLVLLFDRHADDFIADNIDHEYLKNNRDYLYVTFEGYYEYLLESGSLDNIYRGLSDVHGVSQFSEFLDTNLKPVNRWLKKTVEPICTILAKQFEVRPSELDPNLIRNYLAWLAAHDLDTKCVIYFPVLVREEIPSAGILVAFEDVPAATDLINIENSINQAFTLRTNLIMDLEPTFPVCYHRVSFEHRFFELVDKISAGETLTYCVVDFDGLHKFNDKYDHDMGDAVLRAFVKVLHEHIHEFEPDVVAGRWGGDEFMIAALCRNDRNGRLREVLDKVNQFLRSDEFLQYLLYELKNKHKEGLDEDTYNRYVQVVKSKGSSWSFSFSGTCVHWSSSNCDEFPAGYDPKKLLNLINALREIKRDMKVGKLSLEESGSRIISLFDRRVPADTRAKGLGLPSKGKPGAARSN